MVARQIFQSVTEELYSVDFEKVVDIQPLTEEFVDRPSKTADRGIAFQIVYLLHIEFLS